ncbi:hypothetical protein SOPP22_16830 [Shewanella sp. OPT22]|nr:hypothetical protein SOPP22_16830 [Shewanella sp. OPT22]
MRSFFTLKTKYVVFTLLCCIAYYVFTVTLPLGITQDMLTDIVLVMLLYCLLRIFLRMPIRVLALIALGLSLSIELAQFLQYLSLIEIQESPLAWAITTNHYQPVELLAYLFGYLLIIFTAYIDAQYKLWKKYRSNIDS